MAVKIVLKSGSNSFSTDFKEAADDEVLRIGRMLYQNLGSLTKNKTIVKDADYDNEFEKIMFLLDEGPEAGSVLEAVDQYLSDLGVTEAYPYVPDAYESAPWIDPQLQNPIRNVAILDENGLPINNITADGDNVIIYTGV